MQRALVALQEAELRELAKTAGAKWQQDRRPWRMTGAAVYALGLEDRIVE